jgi:hypothetical protein
MADETAKRKAMGGYLCGACDFPVNFMGSDKKTLCYTCGSVNTKPDGDPSGTWLPCILPEGFEWTEPSGVKGPDIPKKRIEGKAYIDYDGLIVLPLSARVIYIDAFGKEFSRMDYIKKYSLDPAIALKAMRPIGIPIIELGRSHS